MKNALCIICLFVSGVLPLAGQSGAGAGAGGDKAKKPGRSAWFACLAAIPEGVENPVNVMGGKEITQLEIPRYMTSEAVEIPEDGILRIVRAVPDPENPAETKYLVLAQATVPAHVREALVILAPLPKPEGDLVFLAKVQDLASFKGGDRLYINLSTSQIRVRLGNDKVTVAPGQADIYHTPRLAKPTNMPIMYEFYAAEDKKWKMITASTVVLRPTRREICVFNSGSRIGMIEKHKILFPVRMPQP
jgi:hypothetical protein